MKLSIIIPIYNVEKYIEKCLMSCIKQNATLGLDYEIICVNDGTTDSSAEIARVISSNYRGIIIVDQVNQGLSMARNKGFSMAKGDYVWFVDSDDWIADNCVNGILQELNNIDILQLEFLYSYDDETKNKKGDTICFEGILTGKDVIANYPLPSPVQFTIYRRLYLIENNLSFIPNILHEDTEFKPRSTYFAQRVKYYPRCCYYYYQRSSGNIMSSFRLKNAQDMLYVANSNYYFFLDKESQVRRSVNCKIASILNSIFNGYWSLNADEQDQIISFLRINKHLLMTMKECSDWKYRLEGICFLINVKLGLFFYKIAKK